MTGNASLGAPPATTAQAIGSALLYAVVAAMAATLEVLLVPVRAGTTVVPVSVILAILTMVVLPVLSGAGSGRTIGAAAPVLAWIVTVVLLSQSRPEGDVLLIGTSPLVYVTYAMLAFGAVCGIATVLSLDRRRLAAAAAQRAAAGVVLSTPAGPPARTRRR